MVRIKKSFWAGGVLLLLLLCVFWIWRIYFSPTHIAFVNYQAVVLGEIVKANQSKSVRIAQLNIGELEQLSRYDMVFINGMGLALTEEQRVLIEEAEKKGVSILSVSVTNPDNAFCSLDSLIADSLRAYQKAGGRTNYRSMLNMVRLKVDGKSYATGPIHPLKEVEAGLFYHAPAGNTDAEPLEFMNLADYIRFLRQNHLWKEGAPRILLTGHMGNAEELVHSLESAGHVVFPVRSLTSFIEQYADSLLPDAVVSMPHGRSGSQAVDYLKAKNIPLLTALNVNVPYEEWEKSRQGMSGGFLSQSIAMPEIDGAVRPYVVFALRNNSDGIPMIQAIPERLALFTEYVDRVVRLRKKANSEKKLAIFYYKGPGQSALSASGMEVGPSLYNLLSRLKKEGYQVKGLPEDYASFARMIQRHGSVFNLYATGAFDSFLKNGNPLWISSGVYSEWANHGISDRMRAQSDSTYGAFPGEYFGNEAGELGLARLDFGNVVLLPQTAAAMGDNSFKIIHGVDAPPPYAYTASYLWVRYGFGADALIHFGTHGSLEFTPGKQVALSGEDWPDRLVGPLPHFYIYSIGNVGEGIIAKRRSYATLQSYLTPPFLESGIASSCHLLQEAIKEYSALQDASEPDERKLNEKALEIKKLTVASGYHKDLSLDSVPNVPYSEEEISRIEYFADELATEKITGQLYILGEPYEEDRIKSSVLAMTAEPIAYSKLALDKSKGRKKALSAQKHRMYFTEYYLKPAKNLVEGLLSGKLTYSSKIVTDYLEVSGEELDKAIAIQQSLSQPEDMMAMMAMMHKKLKSGSGAPEPSSEERERSHMLCEASRAISHVLEYQRILRETPEYELKSFVNALNGGFTEPSPGGDPIAHPNSLPTGRNLYSVNAEATPSERAWEKGKQLAEQTLKLYQSRHHDSLPQKVSYTLWSSEFIETEGATIAQVLYMLGVEPIRDAFGRVVDLRLIPSEELGRPRIDVVVQTSGQLRDIAASRLFLITRAVEMAADAGKDQYENYVNQGVVASERLLIERGISPKEAREVARYRVFGGINGHYATGIQAMVEAGSQWESSDEIADVYLNNMGAFYGKADKWESFRHAAFEAALTGTDAVIQPRQSNTWGALSLDHVYEFMGGLNLAVRKVTGKEPDAYLSDYRNRNHNRMQEVKEAIGIEGRTTLLNPVYIQEKMKGGSGAASLLAATVRNTYGWNVMKPEVISDDFWNGIYAVYVQDKHQLGIHEFFEKESPAALQEMTAVMLETVRKGMWHASDMQVKTLSELHVRLVRDYGAACTEFVCDNERLRRFIKSNLSGESATSYEKQIRAVREIQATDGAHKGMVLKKDELNARKSSEKEQDVDYTYWIVVSVIVLFLFALFIKRIQRKD